MMVFKAAEDWKQIYQQVVSIVMRWAAGTYPDVDQSDNDEDRKREHDRVERNGCADGGDLRSVLVRSSCVYYRWRNQPCGTRRKMAEPGL